MRYRIIVSPIATKNTEDAVEYYFLKASKKVAAGFFKRLQKKLQSFTN